MERSPAPGAHDWEGLVVFFAANNWDDIKMADRHMAEHLARLVPLLYVDPPVTFLTPRQRPELARALERPRLRVVAPSLARLTLVKTPWGQRKGVGELNRPFLRRSLRRAIDRLGGSVSSVLLTGPWPPPGVCGERRRVFWAQDDWAGGASLMGLREKRVLRAELEAAASADSIVTSSPVVQANWRDRGYESTLIPFGCDSGAFDSGSVARPADLDLTSPIAGFIGHINDRIAVPLLAAVAESGMSLALVGPLRPGRVRPDLDALLARPNVRWLEAKPFDELPRYLAHIDVGLVPYDYSAFNLGSFPLKTLEYLAAGVPVVSTDLPATRWLNTDLITIADSPAAFARAVREASRQRREEDTVSRRRSFAVSHDWSRRAEQLADVLRIPDHVPG
jgi:teichuronic acid biosynthesis glycosyltransferase TuaH